MSMLRSKIFIIFFSILTSCRTLDFQQSADEDFDRKMQELSISYNTKAYYPVGRCTVGHTYDKTKGQRDFQLCKRGKNTWINGADKSDNNLYAFDKDNGQLKIIGKKPSGKVPVQRHYINCNKKILSQEELVECGYESNESRFNKESKFNFSETKDWTNDYKLDNNTTDSNELRFNFPETEDWTADYKLENNTIDSQELISENFTFLNNLNMADINRLIGGSVRKNGGDLSNKKLFCEGTKTYLGVYKFKAQKFIEFETYDKATVTDITLTNKSDWESRDFDAYFFNPSKTEEEFSYHIGGASDGIKREKVMLNRVFEKKNKKQVLINCLKKDKSIDESFLKFEQELSESSFACYKDSIHKSSFDADKIIDRTTLEMDAGMFNKFLFGIFGTDTANFSCKIADKSLKKDMLKEYNELKNDYELFIKNRKDEDEANYKI